jgi:hypothetical protein
MPHFCASIASKPCQPDRRTSLTTGFMGDVTGMWIVYSAPPRVLARKVSYVAVALISAIDLTAENPGYDVFCPQLAAFHRNSTPSRRSP